MATSTPWGPSQTSRQYGRGIVSYSTAGHGGFHVCDTLNRQIPAYMRADGGWYEEDCEWAKVAVVFPDRFEAKTVEAAKSTLRNWDYKAYEKFYGVKLKAGESMEKDELAWKEKHKNDYVVYSAVGDWHQDCPKGFVLVDAAPGGRTTNFRPTNSKKFLVPGKEYQKRTGFGFVVNLKRHHEVVELRKAA